jgi:hypothetical protein
MTIEHLTFWLSSASNAKTHREIYGLAMEIRDADNLSPETHRAARKVVKCLRDVIDLPIAKSAVLAKANRRFSVLVDLMKAEANKRQIAA